MLASLGGYLASFVVMALVVWAMANGALNALWGMAGLVLSRMLYGLTVSGLVPAAQTWAIQRAGLDKRMAALATISSGLSCGRLLGPPLAALMLSVSPVAPLWLMALAPFIALLLVLREAADPRRRWRTSRRGYRPPCCLPGAGTAAGGAGQPDAAWFIAASSPVI